MPEHEYLKETTMGGRQIPTECENCGTIIDWGDFGPTGADACGCDTLAVERIDDGVVLHPHWYRLDKFDKWFVFCYTCALGFGGPRGWVAKQLQEHGRQHDIS